MDLEGYKLYKSLRLTWGGQLVMLGRSESPWTWSVSGAAPLAVTVPSASVSISWARSSIPWARPVTAAEVKRSLLALQDNYLGSSRCTADDRVLPFLPAAIELSPQFSRDWLQVHEVAEPSTGTFSVKGDTNKGCGWGLPGCDKFYRWCGLLTDLATVPYWHPWARVSATTGVKDQGSLSSQSDFRRIMYYPQNIHHRLFL